MKKHIVLGLVAVVAATSAAFAGTTYKATKQPVAPVVETCNFADNEFTLDAFGTGAFYRAGAPGWGGGLGVNYFFLRYIGLGYEQDFFGRKGYPAYFGSVGNLFLRLPICSWNLAPYAVGSLGKYYGNNTRSIGFGAVGGGLEYRITRNIGLFSDGRWLFGEGKDHSGAVVRTGLRFAF